VGDHADGFSETQKEDVRALIRDVTHHKAALDAAVAHGAGAAVPPLARALLTPATAENFGYCTTAAIAVEPPPAQPSLFTENGGNHGSNYWLSTLADGSDNEAAPNPGGAGRGAGTHLPVAGPTPPPSVATPPLQPTLMRPTASLAARGPTASGMAASLPRPSSMEPLASNEQALDMDSKRMFEVPGA